MTLALHLCFVPNLRIHGVIYPSSHTPSGVMLDLYTLVTSSFSLFRFNILTSLSLSNNIMTHALVGCMACTETVPSFTAPYLVSVLPTFSLQISHSTVKVKNEWSCTYSPPTYPFSCLPYTCFDAENVRKLLKSSVSK